LPRPVEAVLPAVVRHIPQGSRTARTSYAPVVAEIELRDLSRTDAPSGPLLLVNGGRTVVTRLVDGEAYRGIGSFDPFGDLKKSQSNLPAPDAAAFRGWLEGRPVGPTPLPDELRHSLEATPLLARVPGKKETPRTPPAWNAARQGTILLDTRERMPDLAAKYVAGNVALIDGMPFVRMIGPMAYLTSGGRETTGPMSMTLVNHPGGWTTNAAITRGSLFRFDHYLGAARMLGLDARRIKPTWKAADLADLKLRDDDDLMLMLVESVRNLAAEKPDQGYALDKARCETLEDYAALGSIGAVDPDGLSAAWDFVERFCKNLVALGNAGWVTNEARRIRSYASTHAQPRLAERTFDAGEDAPFLSGLAPA
jgi:hypothetical protein